MNPSAGNGAEMVDLVFSVRGEAVAADHAWLLRQAVVARLPWLGDDESAGIHPLAGLSGIGEVRYLNRRARLTLRLPRQRAAAAAALNGSEMDLGATVTIEGQGGLRELRPVATLYASFVCVGRDDEVEFLGECRRELEAWLPEPRMVCGKARRAAAERRTLRGFSLMLHGLRGEEALRLQRLGLGEARQLGCGIFVPHKSVAAVGE